MRCAIACCLVWLFASSTICRAADPLPIRVGRARHLFFDDRLASSSKGLQRIWHKPRKESAPVLTKSRPWEGQGPWGGSQRGSIRLDRSGQATPRRVRLVQRGA